MSTRKQRSPLHNRVVLAVLASPARRLLPSSLVGLRVTGLRSSRVLTFPVMAAPLGDRLVVYPGHPERKRWWHNISSATPVGLLAEGRWQRASATLLGADEAGHDEAAQAYLRRWPKVTAVRSHPLVVIDNHA